MFNRDRRINRVFIGARDREYKYIQSIDYSSAEVVDEQVFNLESDPSEVENIRESCPDVVDFFQQQLEEYFEEVGLSRDHFCNNDSEEFSREHSDELEERLAHLGYR